VSTTDVNQVTVAAASDTGSQLTAKTQSAEIEVPHSSTAGSATSGPGRHRSCACSTSAATSNFGTQS
jgi:hypothetical protein